MKPVTRGHLSGCLNCIFYEPKCSLTLKFTCDEGTLIEVSPHHGFYCTCTPVEGGGGGGGIMYIYCDLVAFAVHLYTFLVHTLQVDGFLLH